MSRQKTEPKANSIDELHYKVMELINEYPAGKALDFPSGWGRLSYWLEERGYDMTSCDVAIEEYRNSHVKHTFADLNAKFPFNDDQFDYAFCIDGPEHAENLYHTFREFYRVLKPNGYLITSVPNFSNIESRFKQFWYGVLEPVNTRADFKKNKCGTEGFHLNRPPYALFRMALEFAKFTIVKTTFDKEKKKQKYFYPLYLMIKLITILKGEKGERKYWLKSANSKEVLMGGNTLILICKKEGE